MEHKKEFLASIFDVRCKSMFPRDLVVAYVPTKKSRRAVGFVRRTQKFDKTQNRATIYIDFLWVLPEYRGTGIGRTLLLAGLACGRAKDVRLLVAGSDENKVAVKLYESVGLRWEDETKTEMVLPAEGVSVVAPCRAALEPAPAQAAADRNTVQVTRARPVSRGARFLAICVSAGPGS